MAMNLEALAIHFSCQSLKGVNVLLQEYVVDSTGTSR